ncbi:protein PLASTID MOVEMENT IMPAIRED 1-RELATED 1-like [Cicer arietinum]|uniref:Protein PLASTID MOVEMENT IMPAIRED 1-RELATED 1-like n=1 Tax=Cicer arietinum TaxID=3827 RepID=A0A1S2YPN0_CICAR|nr:protein PLASTID MOVEMENT IMPAIRED 1-RELATED 1-like [Cicer arietinum]XP_004507974.1 protein PLASTID MOVEMENT IMPAIRED 1-RELATED 1-like [Cicer arietinum]
MLPKIEEEHNTLLQDVETIRKTLYMERTLSRNSTSSSSSSSKFTDKDPKPNPNNKEDNLKKDKKSIWNWNLLRALSLTRSKKFNCCFSLQIHLIEGLPLSFNDSTLCVHWKRRDEHLVTPPAKVIKGSAEFQDILSYTCSITGSKSGPHNSAKYEGKHFLLYASVVGVPELDLGKHRLDITRLLPLALEDLEEEKSSGKWTTSFRLSGKAKGAVMNVSFGYVVVGDNNICAPYVLTSRQNCIALSETDINPCQYSPRFIDEVKDLHEVLMSSKSVMESSADVLYKKIDDENTCGPLHMKHELVLKENLEPIKLDACRSPDTEIGKLVEHQCNERKTCSPVCGESEFDVFQESLETFETDGYSLSESVNENSDDFSVVDQGIEFNVSDSSKESVVVHEISNKSDELWTKEILLQEIESALNSISELETIALESPKIMEVTSECKFRKSQSLDDFTESVASEFLSMLGVDHSPTGFSSESDPESPRECLLRQFEKDVGSECFSLFNVDYDEEEEEDCVYDASEQCKFSTGIRAPSLLHDLQEGLEFENVRSKPKGHILEDSETEALMREWGWSEESFQHSPPKGVAGFGSPIPQLPEEPPRLPPLAEGFGPFLQTKNGGFLRSMNSSLFRNAKSGGNLIMQVSNPVVMPAEMGSGIMETLHYLASVGIEKLSMQANKFMPLEDITGKTIQQISWESMPNLEGNGRQCHLQHDLATWKGSSCMQRGLKELSSDEFSSISIGNQGGSGFFSLEDLAPLAMDKIEALSMEGLKIQSGMSEEDAPSNIIANSFKNLAGLQAKRVDIGNSLGLDGAAALQLLNNRDSSDEVDGIMELSLTLDEWMRLDSGEIDDIDDISEHTFKLLAAHHANSFDVVRESSKGRKKKGKGHGRKCGLLGNNFTVALMVQLRDPLRNYEPVGTPMLALIQVERVFAPPKQKLYLTVSEVGNNTDEDDECEIRAKVEMKDNKEERSIKEKGIAQFRITEVHVAGLKIESQKKKLWGTSSQQQSGSRWLIANGMSKSNKNPLMKSKVASKIGAQGTTTKVQPGDTLWSISSRIYGTGAKWKELGALNPHIRNPNIIIPNESIRIR